MNPNRHNISAAYGLGESVLAALKGHYGEQHVEDYVDPESESFWKRLHKPHRQTILHTLFTNWEYSRWEEAYAYIDLSGEGFEVISDYFRACAIKMPEWFMPEKGEIRRNSVWALLESAFPCAAEAAFQLLFQDREFLLLSCPLSGRTAAKSASIGIESCLPLRGSVGQISRRATVRHPSGQRNPVTLGGGRIRHESSPLPHCRHPNRPTNRCDCRRNRSSDPRSQGSPVLITR
jgi:hypothetical protein